MAKLTMGEFREWLEKKKRDSVLFVDAWGEALSKLSEVDEGVEVSPYLNGVVPFNGEPVFMYQDLSPQAIGKRGKLIFVEDK